MDLVSKLKKQQTATNERGGDAAKQNEATGNGEQCKDGLCNVIWKPARKR